MMKHFEEPHLVCNLMVKYSMENHMNLHEHIMDQNMKNHIKYLWTHDEIEYGEPSMPAWTQDEIDHNTWWNSEHKMK